MAWDKIGLIMSSDSSREKSDESFFRGGRFQPLSGGTFFSTTVVLLFHLSFAIHHRFNTSPVLGPWASSWHVAARLALHAALLHAWYFTTF
jgi:hypothetical protein